MDYRTNSDTSVARGSIRIPLAGYRVMAWHRDQSQSLVTLAENPRQAVALAKAFCDAIDAGGNQDGIVSVRTEEWVGTLSEGEWLAPAQPATPEKGAANDRQRRERGKNCE